MAQASAVSNKAYDTAARESGRDILAVRRGAVQRFRPRPLSRPALDNGATAADLRRYVGAMLQTAPAQDASRRMVLEVPAPSRLRKLEAACVSAAIATHAFRNWKGTRVQQTAKGLVIRMGSWA